MGKKHHVVSRREKVFLESHLSDHEFGLDCAPQVLPETRDLTNDSFHISGQPTGLFSIGVKHSDLIENLLEQRRNYYWEHHGVEYFVRDGHEFIREKDGKEHMVYSQIALTSKKSFGSSQAADLPYSGDPRRCKNRGIVQGGSVSCDYGAHCPLKARSPTMGGGPNAFCSAG
ncbi:hypothetical protein KA107_00400 [Candidatus Pacearchaeota archaeon]|nr:hypothetical protein [Candidatus Pacearchaeota archaeon]